jgi:hypothetical protein
MITIEELCNWLLDNGYAEEKPGYGHVTGEELAEALLKQYTIVPKLYEPTAEELIEAADWRRQNFPGISD